MTQKATDRGAGGGGGVVGPAPVRLALAAALYKDESLSLGRAAEFSGLTLADFVDHVSRLGIPVVRGANTMRDDMETLDEWLGGGKATS